MADISKITLPSGSTYDIKDQGARDLIEALEGATAWLGVTTTPLTDGAETNPIIIGGKSVTAKTGNMVAYGKKEFVFGTSSTWQEFGDLSALGDLAYKDSATGSVTAAGNVSAPTVTVQLNTDTVQGMDSVGTLPSCTLPTFTATVANENLTIGWAAGSYTDGTLPTKAAAKTFATGVQSAVASTPTFTGTPVNVTVE